MTQARIGIVQALNAELFDTLTDIVQDAVANGASVGWVRVPTDAEAASYWRSVSDAVDAGETVLFVAQLDGKIVGTGQLQLSARENGSHRGEIARLLVHSEARRRGVGAQLMQAIETEAWGRGLSLLVLDTRAGDPSQQLYDKLGWQLAGVIPDYARGTDGALQATAYMFKQNRATADE